MDYGLFASYPGDDVKNTKKRLFDSNKEFLKLYKVGFYSYTIPTNSPSHEISIPHNLGYIPVHWSIIIDESKEVGEFNRQSFNKWWNFGGLGSWFHDWNVSADENNLYFTFRQQQGEAPGDSPPDLTGNVFKFKYYIFYNKLAEGEGDFTMFKVGTFTASAGAGAGSTSVTGVGFKPKLLRFTWLITDSATDANMGIGTTDGTTQFATAIGADVTGGNSARNSETDACILGISSAGAIAIEGAFTSFDTDGFTIAFNPGNSYTIGYEAYG